ncbi:MAG: TraR/DksA C4-type zinc finger protein [Actinobacteria bacterium]|nr:TraR/DksA C4-type zinc finger protein [Actinomycetota bacterium]
MSAKEGGRKKKPSAAKAGAEAKTKGKAKTKPAEGTPTRTATRRAASDPPAATRAAKTGTGAGRKTAGGSASRTASKTGAAPARKRRGAKLDAKTLTSIRAGLVTEKAELLQRQTELDQESFDGSQSEMTGEVRLGEDYADSGTATFDRERDLSIRNNIQDLMDQIDRAVERIDAKSYGICERCGQPIEAARLKALHHAVLCLDCKRREERAR